jgi:hypothetical protein
MGREGPPVRRLEGRKFTKRVENANMTYRTVSPVYKLYQTPVKTAFRVWCLYTIWFMGNIQKKAHSSAGS